MKKILVVFAAILVAGCDLPQTVRTGVLTEQAKVIDIAYMPANHGSGTGVGLSMSGNMVVTSNSVSIPAKYAVVFECEHGRFIVEGTEQKHKDLWSKMKKDMDVVVEYQEVYHYYKKSKRKELVKYDFLNARPVNQFDSVDSMRK